MLSKSPIRPPALLAAPDLLDRWRISHTTLWHWLGSGRCPAPRYRIGNVRAWDLEDIERFERDLASWIRATR
jgi:hypothetical protein